MKKKSKTEVCCLHSKQIKRAAKIDPAVCCMRIIDSVLLRLPFGTYSTPHPLTALICAFFFSGDGIMYEIAGALGRGEKIFITAKLPNYIHVGKEDLIEKYLFLTILHDGSGSITAAFTSIRIVCANTLNAAMQSKTNTVRIRHTSNANDRLAQAHKVMGISDTLSSSLEAVFNYWSKTGISDKEIKNLIQHAMAPSTEVLKKLQEGRDEELSACFNNMVDNVFEYAMAHPTQQTATTKGTVFCAYNAVTGYFQNVKKYKNEEAKLCSILMGGTAQLRGQAAFNLCLDFAVKGFSSYMVQN
ncbi:DUF932 domain-containing protein [Flavobacterium sp. KACC 22763]|uniref:DUF932 domain-containing protein n=1 Tax=Flavobacterium sp. KACC 22763 TaxID=3025668 RepID=UPI002366EFD0|nr:DUF932 domain-containing protein [Flavobacterium sp. KACC 22763]WDF66112.1 DUF932 domain-containing protein [Flavobacterium sp. KACC 22763]